MGFVVRRSAAVTNAWFRVKRRYRNVRNRCFVAAGSMSEYVPYSTTLTDKRPNRFCRRWRARKRPFAGTIGLVEDIAGENSPSHQKTAFSLPTQVLNDKGRLLRIILERCLRN